MVRGRHRQSSSAPSKLPLVAVGALVAAGATLALLDDDVRLLRAAVGCALAAAVLVTALLRARERAYSRELTVEASARRKDEVLFAGQLQAMRSVVDRLTGEVTGLREELAEVTAAHAAAVLVNAARFRPVALTREVFEVAAAALDRQDTRPADPVDPAHGQEDQHQVQAPAPAIDMVRAPVSSWAARLAAAAELAVAEEQAALALARAEQAAPAAPAPADEFVPVAEQVEFVPAGEPVEFTHDGEHVEFVPAGERIEFAHAGDPVEFAPVADPVEQPVVASTADAAPDDDDVIDLTAHDDTQPLQLGQVRARA